jgi:hypothetical protein
MSGDSRHILEEALRLPIKERSRVAADLLRSLEDEEGDLSPEEWERAWGEEVTRRVRAIDAGEAKLIDGDEALRRVRAKLDRSR